MSSTAHTSVASLPSGGCDDDLCHVIRPCAAAQPRSTPQRWDHHSSFRCAMGSSSGKEVLNFRRRAPVGPDDPPSATAPRTASPSAMTRLPPRRRANAPCSTCGPGRIRLDKMFEEAYNDMPPSGSCNYFGIFRILCAIVHFTALGFVIKGIHFSFTLSSGALVLHV
ncbi:hypothetical protein ZEAMMB73_Zm00001d052670 [Zea mays]|uniref:Uncharacterized protein n=1 Tax=Zea mays TaxID=4577 RepID=A0A1D6QIP3_MAIZE|nr:hypothetical protein ZEAMMB73_Zm00001d052670 [Zea mays]